METNAQILQLEADLLSARHQNDLLKWENKELQRSLDSSNLAKNQYFKEIRVWQTREKNWRAFTTKVIRACDNLINILQITGDVLNNNEEVTGAIIIAIELLKKLSKSVSDQDYTFATESSSNSVEIEEIKF